MKILAIESSAIVASVAIVEDEKIIAEYTMNNKKTHSQTLLPMIDEICKLVEYDLTEIDAIAVSAGPGSFTGLRIGSATAKGLGLALKKPLIHVPTVEAMAYNFFSTEDYIVPIMDARRNQVYTGIYEKTGSRAKEVLPQCIMMIEELLVKINELQHSVLFLGDGVPAFQKLIEEKAEVPVRFAPANLNHQTAGAVAELAKIYFAEGRMETAAEHAPDYLRLSQAERERQSRNN